MNDHEEEWEGEDDGVRARFEKYVSPEPNTGCWLWTGTVVKSTGYGQLCRAGKMVSAHRLSWALHRGYPGKLSVLHKCDVRSCVNPAHLFTGTQRDNMHDMIKKGRAAVGERQGSAKLTEAKVREIRRLRSEGAKIADLASQFELSMGAVGGVIYRRNWKDVA